MLEEKNTLLWYFSVSGPFDPKYMPNSSMILTVWVTVLFHRNTDADHPFYITNWNIFNFTPLQFSDNRSARCLFMYFQAHSEVLEFIVHLGSFTRERFQCSTRLHQQHIKYVTGRLNLSILWCAPTRALDSSAGGMWCAAEIAPSHMYYTVSFNFIQNFASVGNKWLPRLTQYHQEQIPRAGLSDFKYFIFTSSLIRFSD